MSYILKKEKKKKNWIGRLKLNSHNIPNGFEQ